MHHCTCEWRRKMPWSGWDRLDSQSRQLRMQKGPPHDAAGLLAPVSKATRRRVRSAPVAQSTTLVTCTCFCGVPQRGGNESALIGKGRY